METRFLGLFLLTHTLLMTSSNTRNRPGFHKATRVGILFRLRISTLNISFNLIAIALKLCLSVKHGMFHRQTKFKCNSNKIQFYNWDLNFEFEHDLDSGCFVQA